ncbi:hypothetical protein ASF19_20170 [Acidovorax sp. Leaf84]|uniref:hypothetical protein n=1 Tax=Acidovorax sp. Leaf84 TaxID=1736240 RepID=UPI0007006F82|nr:hypothetical protein [Acidovorax sp. Leaf84]KQO38093.1 hypothetical protein ASF19_20170 [Acidovorax sp. Leaf84]
MAAKKFLRLIAGGFAEVLGIVTSAGAANAGDIPALDDNGRLDNSLMPVGIGADTKVVVTSEALAAGDWVNLWNSTGLKARKADATVAGKEAWGFVLSAVTNGGNATVYFEGTNNQVSSQTVGPVYLQTTAGQGGATVPSSAGNIVQMLGVALSATEVNFERGTPVTLA